MITCPRDFSYIRCDGTEIIEEMTDFHTHILPGIDDGARDIEMTEAMLRAEAEQGVTHIYATPHFYAHRRSVQRFLERREGALAETREMIARRQAAGDIFPEITAGAEVYYFGGIGRAEQLPELCIEGTDILLLEMPFCQWDSDMYRDVKDILGKRQLRIVLAHVERYHGLQKDRDVWNRITGLPLSMQMNAESFTGGSHGLFGGMRDRRHIKWCMQMLNDHDNMIIGTDCHNMGERAPNLAEARAEIENRLGSERLAELDRYTEELLG